MHISEHFTLEELTFTQHRKLDNRPPPEIEKRLQEVLAPGLEKVRAILMSPMRINSGYRSPAVNKAVGGAKNSAHVQGYAADFISHYGPPLAVCRLLELTSRRGQLVFDQLIYEHTWTHISFDPRSRGQILTFKAGKYLPGIVA